MYQIFCGEYGGEARIVFDPRLGLPVTEASLELATDKAGALTIALPPAHPEYGGFLFRKTELWVLQDGEEIFRGRVLDKESDIENTVTVVAEGLKAYLRDERLRPCKCTTAAGFLQTCCETYNQYRSGAAYPFEVESCDEAEVEIESDDYPSILDAIDSKLLREYGGTVTVRRHDGKNKLSYTTGDGAENAQAIAYGVNLLTLDEKVETKDVYSAVIPLGKATDDVKLTVARVNGGKDYIVNDAAFRQYGLVLKTESFSDIEDANELLREGRKIADQATDPAGTVELSAVDLRDAGYDVQHFRLGMRNRVRSGVHGVSTLMPLVRIKLDLLSPDRSSYTFSAELETLTQKRRTEENRSRRYTEQYADEAVKKANARYSDYVAETGSADDPSGFYAVRKWNSGIQDMLGAAVTAVWGAWAPIGSTGLSKAEAEITLSFPFSGVGFSSAAVSTDSDVMIARCAHAAGNKIRVTGMAPTGAEPSTSALDLLIFGPG